MSTDDIKRINYYERQFLGAQDFREEQGYHIEMRRRHLIGHHRWGIVAGLQLTKDENSGVWAVGPGMAVDAYGREIYVFDPEPLNVESIAARLAGLQKPAFLKVWLAYRLEKSNRPAPAYHACDESDLFMRVRETFRFLYQDDPPFDFQNAANPDVKDAEKRLTWPQAAQDLPDDPRAARWPVYLGTLKWDTDPDNPAQNVIAEVFKEDPRDKLRRRYVGVVAEELEAPDDRLLVRGRGFETPLPGNAAGVVTELEGSLEVFRQLTADKNLNVLGNVGIGISKTPPPVRLQVGGGKDASLKDGSGYVVIGSEGGLNLVLDNNELMARDDEQKSALHLQAEGGELHVHSKQAGGTQFVVLDNGRVGVGTSGPDRALTVRGPEGTYINVRADGGAHEVLIGADGAGGIVSTMTDHDLQLRAGVNSTKMIIKAGGNVGVGTNNPSARLHVAGGTDAKFDEDSGFVVIGPVTGKNLVLDDNEILARNNGQKTDLNLQADGGSLLIHDNVAGTRVAVTNDGNLGVGTTSPNKRVTVEDEGATYLNVKGHNGAEELLIGAEGAGGVVSTMTNHALQLRTNNSNRIYVKADGDVGVGTNSPVARLHVVDNKTGDATLPNHVAVIENASTGDSADVLALKIGAPVAAGASNNFVTFFRGGNVNIGRIEGLGAGVTYETTAGDYAEFLPRLAEDELIEAGDVVGVFGGKVTRATAGAHQLMTITDQAAVLGNMPAPEAERLHEKVAFIGQVRVRVRGPVNEGDYIVPSGADDGCGVAVAPERLGPAHFAQIVGRAWESDAGAGVRRINTAIGLPANQIGASVLAALSAQQEELRALKVELQSLKARALV